MTTNNDIPMLICHLLNTKPWIKQENKIKYIFQGTQISKLKYKNNKFIIMLF